MIVDIFESFDGELIAYANSVASLNRIVHSFRYKLEEDFEIIKTSDNFEVAVDSFDSMFRVQRALAVAKYKYKLELGDFILDFIYKFDRDDLFSRRYIYGVIKVSPDLESAVSSVEV